MHKSTSSSMLLLVFATVFAGVAKCAPVDGLDAAPPGCRWQRTLNPDSEVLVQLSCFVKTAASINGLLGNLTGSQIAKIDAIKFTCTDMLFFESSLHVNASDFVGRLRRIKNLQIEDCKIRYVPAMVLSPLRDLTELTMRSRNDDWSSMTMEFHEESFRGLTELRHLDLGDNNIWTFPPGVFCPLFTLKSLNLTANHLQDVSEVGFSDWGKGPMAPGKSCNTGLKVLDLSHNNLVSLPDNGLSSLRSLEILNLQNNVLVEIEDRAFVGLTALRILNASSNRLVALPPELFLPSREIRTILLSNNSLSVLAPDLLKGLDQLLVLDLSQNKLTNSYVNRETFAGLIRLVILNLSHNKLTRLDPKLFQDLKDLEDLYLDNNAIDTISGGAFVELTKLKRLSLSQNRLKYVDEHFFSNLYVLSELYLDDNRLVSIHSRCFENITYLEILGLSGNNLVDVPEAIRKLRFLKSLDIGKNNITTIKNNSFEGLEVLYGLRLVDNNIVNISADAFYPLPSLQILNLASNKVERIEEGAFDFNPVIIIRLDGNRLKDIRGVFNKSRTLGWLNISDNAIERFDYGSLPESIEWLDLHQNKIPKLENVHGIHGVRLDRIKRLDVSYNLISEIDELSVPDSVEDLFLNNNKITSIRTGTFQSKRNIRKVVLHSNRMRTVDLASFSLPVMAENRDMPHFYIGGNPFVCDCTMDWLQNINQWNHLRQYPRFMDLESVTCQLVRGSGEIKPVLELPPTQFLCPYNSQCASHCFCCDFEACDCKMTCPDRCSCYRDNSWSSNVIDCSNANYTNVPEKIPMDATEIYLDGNNFGSLGNHIFIGKRKLSVLFLNNSNIASIENGTFNGLYSLKTLHLGNNHISDLKGHEFNQTKHLKELYLDHNAISNIDNNTFASVTSLKILHLEYNKIRDFDPKTFRSTHPNLGRIHLEGNMWSCDCDNVYELEKWMKSNKENLKNMICINGSDDNMTVSDAIVKCYEVLQTNVVPSENQPFAFREMDVGINYVPLLSIILIAVILICLFGALMFSFRQDVRLWAHSKYGVRIFRNNSISDCELDKDRMYDAYMVYSILDDDFVSRVISPELEQSGYSMCLHYRDLQISSDNYLSETLINATEASKRLILVISFSFLQNEWSKPNFKRAMKNTIESINPSSLRRHKVIFVLTTDVSALNLDADLQSFFKICTVVFWGEKRFWEKIRFAMPDIANLQWNKSPIKSNNQMPNGRRSTSTRYTASPTSLDQWYKYAALPPQPLPAVPTPGDDSSLLTSTTVASQQYDGDPLNHSYVSIDTHCYERSRREGRHPLDEQGYLRPRPAPHPA